MSLIPTTWDETRFIDGFPGKYVVMARKSGTTWYIAGINGEESEKEITFTMPFVSKAATGNLYTDGNTNRSFIKSVVHVKKGGKIKLKIMPTGGFVIKVDE